MSDKDRKKKDGERKDKKNERMRDAVKERKKQAEAHVGGQSASKEAGLHSDTGDVNRKPNAEMQGGPLQPSAGKPG